MAYITVAEVNAWLEATKSNVTSLETELESSIATQVLGRLTNSYDVTTWTDNTNTPKLVRKIIAMLYAGWYYDKIYSETSDTNDYALRLKAEAEKLLDAISAGTIDLAEVAGLPAISQPSFFPTDASSSASPTNDDPSVGDAKFLMGSVF